MRREFQSWRDAPFRASRRTVERMTRVLGDLDEKSLVLDIGSGYGGAARYLAKTYNCRLQCLNLCERQNDRNYHLCCEQDLEQSVTITEGVFEDIPFPDSSFDIVWSQDAMLHSPDRAKVVAEAYRVLKPGKNFIFTDIMQKENCPREVLVPVLKRINLDSMGTVDFYQTAAVNSGFREIRFIDLSEHLVTHYWRVMVDLQEQYSHMSAVCSREYLDNMIVGLKHWIDAGKQGYLSWGIFHFRK